MESHFAGFVRKNIQTKQIIKTCGKEVFFSQGHTNALALSTDVRASSTNAIVIQFSITFGQEPLSKIFVQRAELFPVHILSNLEKTNF